MRERACFCRERRLSLEGSKDRLVLDAARGFYPDQRRQLMKCTSKRLISLSAISLPILVIAGAGLFALAQGQHQLDAQKIADAAGTKATTKEGVVRIEWPRNDVAVK